MLTINHIRSEVEYSISLGIFSISTIIFSRRLDLSSQGYHLSIIAKCLFILSAFTPQTFIDLMLRDLDSC